MFRGKEHYDKPETALARLELESPICSGSVYNDGANNGITTTATPINDSFGADNNYFTTTGTGTGTGGWDEIGDNQ